MNYSKYRNIIRADLWSGYKTSITSGQAETWLADIDHIRHKSSDPDEFYVQFMRAEDEDVWIHLVDGVDLGSNDPKCIISE